MNLLNKIPIVLLTYLLCLLSISARSQEIGEVKLDSLTLTTRNVQDASEFIPKLPGDTAYVEPKVEVTIRFAVSNIENLQSVEIVFEKEKRKKDFKVFKMDFVTNASGSFLKIKNRTYPVVNAIVIITEPVAATLLSRKIYFSVQATDKNQRVSNILTQEFN